MAFAAVDDLTTAPGSLISIFGPLSASLVYDRMATSLYSLAGGGLLLRRPEARRRDPDRI